MDSRGLAPKLYHDSWVVEQVTWPISLPQPQSLAFLISQTEGLKLLHRLLSRLNNVSAQRLTQGGKWQFPNQSTPVLGHGQTDLSPCHRHPIINRQHGPPTSIIKPSPLSTEQVCHLLQKTPLMWPLEPDFWNLGPGISMYDPHALGKFPKLRLKSLTLKIGENFSK